MSRLVALCLGIVVLFSAFRVGFAVGAADEKAVREQRFFEIRTYTAADGKLRDLHRRFREHTHSLFQKHGMTPVGYWVPTEGPEAQNTLVYILAYPSREAHAKSWEGFRNDPDWQTARKASEANGPLVTKVVSQFLTPTDYSPLK